MKAALDDGLDFVGFTKISFSRFVNLMIFSAQSEKEDMKAAAEERQPQLHVRLQLIWWCSRMLGELRLICFVLWLHRIFIMNLGLLL